MTDVNHFLESILTMENNLILPEGLKPKYESLGRGRPSKKKLARRKEYFDWIKKIKITYKKRE